MAKKQGDLERGVAAMLALRPSGNDVQFKVRRGVTRPVWEPDAIGMALY
jgi:glutamate carboxypeptidase